MSLVRLRRRSAPLSLATLAIFLFSLSPARFARAEREVVASPAQAPPLATADEIAQAATPVASSQPPPTSHGARPAATSAPAESGVRRAASKSGEAQIAAQEQSPLAAGAATAIASSLASPFRTEAAPIGGSKTGVSSQAISLPQGTGKVQGMGESFSTQLSTGVATFTVPFALVPARGGAQPALSLSYSSASGHGIAGVGWDVGLPFIARQTDRGIPQYNDPSTAGAWAPTQDRFSFSGGQELVPICLVSGGACPGALAGEVMPAWAEGSQYFRPRVEGSFLRFFWSPDHRSWRVQSKSGTTMELGVPLDDAAYLNGVETDPADASRIFKWNIVREYDAYGDVNPGPNAIPAPVNVIVYRYMQDGGTAYLQDVYDTPPAANPISAPLSAYSHHVRLNYEARTDATSSYRRGWPTTQAQRLRGADVTSQTFGAVGPRELVRRYHLTYDASYHVSLLASVQMEGRCAQPVVEGASGSAADSLPATTACPVLPAMTFGYQHVSGFDTSGSPTTPDVPGWEAFDERVHTIAKSPDHSIDESLTDLFDINADGLPDVIVTAPYLYGGKDAVFFNGAGGVSDAFGASQCLDVAGVPGEDTNLIRLDNPNIAAHDIDGDGVINLLHMPLVKTYSIYTPQPGGCGWQWQGRQVTTASQQSPKIDLTNHNAATKVMDVNGDGLVDVVFSSGTEYQTFFALGRFPTGDGQYGTAQWTGASAASISNDPVTSCLPWSATPALLSDPDVRIGDMNGDGLPDVVRVRAGEIRYWPGRGNGFWGTGNPNGCPGGTFGQNQDIAMTTSPQYGVVDGTQSLLLDDINGDGFDDLVKVEFNAVYVWLNVDGAGWTSPHIIQNSPARAPTVDRLRLVDINGSGTRDVLYGDGYAYKYIDVNGGSRPWVLTHVQNGRGKTTDIAYGTSTQFMLADAATGNSWTSLAPMPIHVVTQMTMSDHLDLIGRTGGVYVTKYSYRDAVYDGRQREFRGFRIARETKVGDSNSPSSTSESTFLTGDCKNDENQSPDPCSEQGRWADNPREALKGLPILTETHDDGSVYRSTEHHTYRLRRLYAGLDGREVRYGFESQADSYLYDDGPFTPTPDAVTLVDVELETLLGQVATDTASSSTLRAVGGRAHLHRSSLLDAFGNATDAVDDGCVNGCATADESITTHTIPGRPPGDLSGWLYRTVESYVLGSNTPGQRKDTLTQYDVGGNPTVTRAILVGTLGLDRFHESPSGATAPAPMSASQDGTITVRTRSYDGFGQLQHDVVPNSRCRAVTYDASYDELPVLESVYVGPLAQVSNGCGPTPLSAIATYDRGLHAAQTVTDLHGEVTTLRYDGFGRIAALTKPDPQNPTSPSAVASVIVAYLDPTDPDTTPYTAVHTRTQDGATADTPSYRDLWSFSDGLGRAILTLDQADPASGDGAPWIANGVADFDAKGATRRAYLAWFWTGSPDNPFPLGTPPSPYGSERYDAFGRPVQTFGLDGAVAVQNVLHALSVDRWDAADLMPGPHQGTAASVTQDGHGRTIAVTERIHNGTAIEARVTNTTYLSTGEPAVIARVRGTAGATPVVRWMQYDSLGRLVANVEPDTTTNFTPAPTAIPAAPTSMRPWRYAYNDNGDLVGTSDARGCGANYHYDAGGRTVAEDFSPCLTTQPAYSPPNLLTGDGTEAFYTYDAIAPDIGNIPGCAVNGSLVLGRLVRVADRGSEATTSYDGRGRTVCTALRLTVPGDPNPTLSARYAPHWYTQAFAYDGADRLVQATTGIDPDISQLLDPGGQSLVSTQYSKRGTVVGVGSGYGSLVAGVTHAADGLVNRIVYGDTAATTSAFSYDARRRFSGVQTYRGVPATWSSPPASYQPPPPQDLSNPPSAFQLLLEDVDYHYDDVDNPIEIDDWRNPAEWPAGAKPVTRKITYDDLYRVTKVDYVYPGASDSWTSPFDAEDNALSSDPRRAQPSPHVSFSNRVVQQSFQYDWLGNTSHTDDDAHGFYDRSLGAITNGTAALGPYRLESATGVSSTRAGSLTTAYDSAGNLTSLAVARGGPCVPSGAVCSQRFAYDWDEVGRLVQARRWDSTSPGAASDPLPAGAPAAALRYAYNANDDRTLKTAVDPLGNEVYSGYAFPSLELRRTTWNGSDYDRTATTEVGYIFANGARLARVHYAGPPSATETGSPLHVLLELPDHLGSTSIVIDRDSGELVERGTYMAFGQAESDYRPTRWAGFREDYEFTGKEDDIEVGLQYFGKRFYSPNLNRWVSADPLAVHALGADANVYAYVHGEVFRAVDPMGLDDTRGSQPQGTNSSGGAQPSAVNVAAVSEVITDIGPNQPKASLWGSDPTGKPIGNLKFETGDAARAFVVEKQIQHATIVYNMGAMTPQERHDIALRVQLGGIPDIAQALHTSGEGHNPLGEAGNVGTQRTPGKFDTLDALIQTMAGGSSSGVHGGVGNDGKHRDEVSRGSTAGQVLYLLAEVILSAVEGRLLGHLTDAKKAAGGPPRIKAGSSGGATAGERFTQGVRQEAFAENPTKTCVYCAREGTGTQVDHAVSRANGGNATVDNAQLACPHCNASKGAGQFPRSPPPGYEGPWPPPHWKDH
jgi:RHS repeat-associated protein